MAVQQRKTRIFVVDDHPLMRDGMTLLISGEADLQICGSAGSMQDAMKQVASAEPDLMVVDLSLKDGLGLDLIKSVKERFPKIRMLVVSAFEENLYAERALRSGASGYVNKQECDTTLLQAIRVVLAGRRYVSDEILQRLIDHAIDGTSTDTGDPVERLTDRELEIFRLIGQGATPAAIAKKLHISPHTIDSHRENMRHKLGVTNGRELMQRAMRWVLEHDEK
ncbi:MAG TPA: response regulator transcription factor [Planctomycetaceae bacterium]|nr:response regulator transcription factor [Planctomycetaceae bacterium]